MVVKVYGIDGSEQRDIDLADEVFNRSVSTGSIYHAIRNELANEVYDTAFMAALFEEEGGDLFDVRQAILGHMQQGGDPTPFDRILATRFAAKSIDYLEQQIKENEYVSACIGQVRGQIQFTNFLDVPRLLDKELARPKDQWWLALREIAQVMAQPEPGWDLVNRQNV